MLIYLSMLDTDEEREKLSVFYESNKQLLISIAVKILKNPKLSEDALHNTIMSIINNKEKYLHLPCRDLTRLSVIIIKRKCIDILRKQKDEDSFDEIEFELPSDEDIQVQTEYKEKYDDMKRHMSELSMRSQLILEMKYVEGLTYKQIAEHLSLTEKHVDTIIARAKGKIRKLSDNERE